MQKLNFITEMLKEANNLLEKFYRGKEKAREREGESRVKVNMKEKDRVNFYTITFEILITF